MYIKAGVAPVTSDPAGLRGLLSPYLSPECLSKVSPCEFLKATETVERVRMVLPLGGQATKCIQCARERRAESRGSVLGERMVRNRY